MTSNKKISRGDKVAEAAAFILASQLLGAAFWAKIAYKVTEPSIKSYIHNSQTARENHTKNTRQHPKKI